MTSGLRDRSWARNLGLVLAVQLCGSAVSGSASVSALSDPDPCDISAVVAPQRRVGTGSTTPDPCYARWGITRSLTTGEILGWGQKDASSSQAPWAIGVGGSGIFANLIGTLSIADENTSGSTRLNGMMINGVWGSNLSINLNAPLSTGDFLDPMPTLEESSICLAPAGSGYVKTGWQGLTHPTLGGAVDLITGLPIVKTTDLELPFGGAMFRLNRTRSTTHWFNNYGAHANKWMPDQDDRWWDWTGMGWMASENPLLVIDGSQMNLVGDNPDTTWLVLDAYHSIPFQHIEGTDRYEAPPRFRARLTHNGQYGVITYPTSQPGEHAVWPLGRFGWTVPPTKYTVSLYEGLITYTFVVVRDDVPNHYWNAAQFAVHDDPAPSAVDSRILMNYHERPIRPDSFVGISGPPTVATDPYNWELQPGLGLPYYGLCVEIKDRNSHRVEIEYCDVVRKAMDDPNTVGCVECQTNGPSKGQIKAIRLWTGDRADWTLVYAHRNFARVSGINYPQAWTDGNLFGASETADPGRYEQWGYTEIDSIYAYEGKVGVDHLVDFPAITIPHTDAPGFDHETDALAGTGLPTTWKHRVRYHYNTFIAPATGETPPTDLGYGVDRASPSPILVMTTLQSKEQSQTASQATRRRKVFEYTAIPTWQADHNPNATHPFDSIWLEGILEEDDVSALIHDGVDVVDGSTSTVTHVALDLRKIALQRDASDVSLDADTRIAIANRARVRMVSGKSVQVDPIYGSSQAPSREALRLQPGIANQYYLDAIPNNRLQGDTTSASVAELSMRDGSSSRYFRILRFRQCPIERPDGESDLHPGHPDGWSVMGEFNPQASAFVVPYAWHASFAGSWHHQGGDVTAPDDLIAMPNLEETRWLSIIDEFKDRASMTSGNSYDNTTGIKPGQISRRVVELNGSGVVVGDRTWKYEAGSSGVTVAGASLGVKYKYQTVEGMFGSTLGTECEVKERFGMPDPNVDPTPPTPCPVNATTKAFRHELLLTEKRSVSWSAANNTTSGSGTLGDTKGLVEFYEFDLLSHNDWTFDPAETSKLRVGWGERLKMARTGVRKGVTGDNKAYVTQDFYGFDPSSPTSRVRFNTPRATALSPTGFPKTLADLTPGTVDSTLAVTYSDVQRTPVEGKPLWECPIKVVTAVQPPQKARPDGSWLYPITRSVYDPQGNAPWQIVGLVRYPNAPNASAYSPEQDERLIFNFSACDGLGRPVVSVVDAVPGNTYHAKQYDGEDDASEYATYHADYTESDQGVWRPMRGFVGSTTIPALEYRTCSIYDAWGLSDQFFPSGRRWARRFTTNDPSSDPGDEYADEFTFPALTKASIEGSTVWLTQSPCEYKKYKGQDTSSEVDVTQVVHLTSPLTTFELGSQTPSNHATWNPLVRSGFTCESEKAVRIGLDANGRPSQADLLEPNAQGVLQALGSKYINDLVDVRREQEIDHNISRVTRDLLGHSKRAYKGTSDLGWIGDAYDSQLDPQGEFNLVMVERTEWGSGQIDTNAGADAIEQQINSTWQPTIQRRYDRRPSGGSSGEWDRSAFYQEPTSDPIAFASKTYYDWRRRAVRVDRFDRGDVASATRAATSLTFLDHANRPRLEVEFGRGTLTLAASMDPSRLGVTDTGPAATAYFTSPQGIVPSLARETDYDPAGHVSAVRTYRPAPTSGGLSYVCESEQRGYGLGGTLVYTRSINGRISKSALDGLGRVIRQSDVILVGTTEFEMSASAIQIDPDGNQLCRRELERTGDPFASGAVAVLSDTQSTPNAVRSRSVTWYDTQNRVIATAALGTEAGSFVLGSEVFTYSASTPPTLSDSGTYTAPQGLPANASVTVNLYDRAGRIVLRRDPSGACTRMEYDLGNLKVKTENCFAADAHDKRITKYNYKWGHLIEMAVEDGVGSPTSPNINQRTVVCYGADIVDDSFVVKSRDNALTGKVYLTTGTIGARHEVGSPAPNPASDLADFTYRYNFSGKLAERIDKRGISARYSYDSLERLSEIEIGYFDTGGVYHSGYPADPYTSVGAPVDRVGFVSFGYDARGRLTDVIAKTSRTAPTQGVVARNQYNYDAFGSLLSEIQSHGDFPASGPIPTINYAWSYNASTTDGTLLTSPRLGTMQYPIASSFSPARSVTLAYGASTSTADSILSRLTQVTTAVGTGSFSNVADLTYIGSYRRSRLALASGLIAADFDAGSTLGLDNLDPFGRPMTLAYKRPDGTTLFSADYTYDAAGNRTTAKIVQSNEGSQAQSNRRSQINAYDSLMRLIGTQVGQVDFSSQGVPSIHAGTSLRSDTWWMDAIGNTNGGYRSGSPFGRDSAAAIDLDNHTAVRYSTNHRNEINSATFRTSSGGSQSVNFAYDRAGNLIFDGSLYYQYDAWNRLVQLNVATPLSPPSGFVPGDPVDPALLFTVSATVVKHFTYDGFGRLINAQSPFPDIQTANGRLRLEHFYYDGIRRVQEVVSDGVLSLGEASESEEGEVQTAAGASAAAQGENPSGGATPLSLAVVIVRAHPLGTYLNHEYIWGPGDNGIDELLVQYDFGRKAWFTLTDAGGDVVATCDKTGSGSTLSTSVGAQWTYDAYGNVLTAWVRDADVPAFFCGHKGLFVERLDVGVATSTGFDSPRLSPLAEVFYHNRNRVYSPVFGRFAQSDPNATGLLVLMQLCFHGQDLALSVPQWSADVHFGDGMNAFAYAGSSPWLRADPLGLSLLELLGPTSTLNFELDNLQNILEQGNNLRSDVQTIGEEYGMSQELDVDWATDWKRDDFAFSRAGSVGEETADGAINSEPGSFGLPVAGGADVAWGGRLFTPIADKYKYIKANGHHLIPKFLKGAKRGTLKQLVKWKHDIFHQMLDRALQMAPGKWPAMNQSKQWEKRLKGITKAEAKELRRVLYETSKRFESEQSVPGFAGEVIKEILSQRWLQ